MVDSAPPPEEVLPELGEPAGRPGAGGAQRRVRPPRAAAGLRALRRSTGPTRLSSARWPLARRFAPLVRQRKLALLADSLGIEVTWSTARCPTPSPARACLRPVPAPVRARRTIGDARRAACAPAAARASASPRRAGARPRERPDLSTLPDDPGVYVFRDERGRPLYVGKSVSLRTRARAHFCAPAGLDRARGDRRLQAHQLRARRARAGEPADQGLAAARQQGAQAHRPLGLPALPAGHRVPRARGLARARARPRGERRAPARAKRAGRRAGRPPHARCSACATAAAGCDRASTRRSTGRWAAAAPPASATSTRMPTGARSTGRWPSSTARTRGETAARRRSTRGCARPPRERRYERAAALLRRRERLAGAARAARGRAARDARGARGWCWRAIRQGAPRRLLDRRAAGWSTGARCPGPAELAERTRGGARAARAGRSARCRPTRSTRCGSSPAGWPTTSRPSCSLEPPPSAPALLRFAAGATAASPAPAPPRASGSRATARATSA